MNILSPHGFEEGIPKTAPKLEVTVYHASYIVLAKNNELTLVTEDKELKAKANSIIEAKNLVETIP